MSKFIAAALAGVLMTSGLAAAPALAQAPAAAAGKIDFANSKISAIAKDAKAKAILEKAIPQITDYYDQIGDMTLTDVIPMSQGALDEAKLKAMQAEYDKA